MLIFMDPLRFKDGMELNNIGWDGIKQDIGDKRMGWN
jgi:hypothetical protein